MKADRNEIITIAISVKTINVNAVTLTSTTVLLNESSKVKELEAPLKSLNIATRIIEEHSFKNGQLYISLYDNRTFYGLEILSDVMKAQAILENIIFTQRKLRNSFLKHIRVYK